ncbi:MAG: hypothetical protein FWG84_00610 [Bacteroidales bacterium]|nr:hypothetical protein [Bacteroidales bacterium]
MNKVFLLIFMASAIVALTTGCEDKRQSDDDDGGIETDNMLPSEIIYSNDDGLYDVTKFWYNDKSRIIKAEWYHRDTLYSVQDYAYDKSGKLTSITYNGGNSLSFVYSGNFVTVYFGGTPHSLLHELQNDLLINDYESGMLSTTYSYDSKNNAIKVSNKFERETSITYEDKSGIYSGINMPQWFLMFDYATFRYPFHVVNNPLQIEKTQNGSSSIYTYNYETYNEKNYPTQFTVTETKSNSADSSTAYYEIKYIDAK